MCNSGLKAKSTTFVNNIKTEYNGRKQYIEKLNKYFDYSKTREDLFDVLSEKGSLEDAKKRARKMYQEFLDAKISSMSAMVPATRVFELVEELEGYLNN